MKPTVFLAKDRPARRVWKFGGTSVADADRIRAVARRVVAAAGRGQQMVVVLSAMGQTTDDLIRLAAKVSPGGSAREMDALLAVGETISCALAARATQNLGVDAISLSGGEAGFLTDDRHGDAALVAVDAHRIEAHLSAGYVVFVTGFQGTGPDGSVTTLGRGGSDASAIALAAALGLSECDIYTDVDGVFTADPRRVPTAVRHHEISHRAMLALALGGAQVMQPRAIGLAQRHRVNIHVRSSFSGRPGTWIREEEDMDMFEPRTFIGVTMRQYDPLYYAAGWPTVRLCALLADNGIALASLSEVGADQLRFSCPGAEPARILAALGSDVTTSAVGSVGLVLAACADRAQTTANALSVLERHGLLPVLVTAGLEGLTLHLPTDQVLPAACLLHDTFLAEPPGTSSPLAGAREYSDHVA